MNRLGADVNDFFIRWIDSHRPDVALQNSAPALTGVLRAVDSIPSEPQIDDVGLASRTVYGVDGSFLERNGQLIPRIIVRTPDIQTLLSTSVNAHATGHTLLLLFAHLSSRRE